MDEEGDAIGKLKVSLEAAKALTGIYREFHREKEPEKARERARHCSVYVCLCLCVSLRGVPANSLGEDC